MTCVRSWLGITLLSAAVVFLAVRSVLPGGARERTPPPLAAPPVPAELRNRWVELFNGRDLLGWRLVGGGRASVRDGLIVLENDSERRSGYLVSELSPKDFQLEFCCRIEMGDSGLLFRAHPEPRTPTEFIGPQVQLNRATDAGLGGVYESHGRGWLARPAQDIETALARHGEWLHVQLDVTGPQVRVQVNGLETANLEDTDPANRFVGAGRLGWQIHGGCFVRVYIKSIRVWVRE